MPKMVKAVYTTFNFASWTEDTINGNIYIIILLTSITVGLMLVTAGLEFFYTLSDGVYFF